MRGVFLILMFVFGFQSILAQEKQKETPKKHSIKKATLLSIVLPGAGQVYNKKWWKVPLIYGAMGTTTYLAIQYNDRYKIYRDAYQLRQDGKDDPFKGKYNTNTLLTFTQDNRNDRDINIMITAGLYGLQVLDAYIDANMFDFDVDDNLSLLITPIVIPQENQTYVGLSLNLYSK